MVDLQCDPGLQPSFYAHLGLLPAVGMMRRAYDRQAGRAMPGGGWGAVGYVPAAPQRVDRSLDDPTIGIAALGSGLGFFAGLLWHSRCRLHDPVADRRPGSKHRRGHHSPGQLDAKRVVQGIRARAGEYQGHRRPDVDHWQFGTAGVGPDRLAPVGLG